MGSSALGEANVTCMIDFVDGLTMGLPGIFFFFFHGGSCSSYPVPLLLGALLMKIIWL